MKKPIVAFVGLTHLGLNSAIASAQRGYQIVAYDQNLASSTSLKNQKLVIVETGLEEMLLRNTERIAVIYEQEYLKQSGRVYFSIKQPTDDTGTSNISLLM